MTKILRDFFIGAGSVLDVCPSSRRLRKLVPRDTTEKRLQRVWDTVGNDLRAAMSKSDCGPKQKNAA